MSLFCLAERWRQKEIRQNMDSSSIPLSSGELVPRTKVAFLAISQTSARLPQELTAFQVSVCHKKNILYNNTDYARWIILQYDLFWPLDHVMSGKYS